MDEAIAHFSTRHNNERDERDGLQGGNAQLTRHVGKPQLQANRRGDQQGKDG